MLPGLGTDDDAHDEAVYRVAMAGSGTTARAAAEVLGRPADDVDASLERLASRGLVVRSGREGRWAATPPELVLGPELARERERLRRAEEQLADLVETFHRERSPQAAGELVEIVEGRTQGVRLAQIERAARHTLCAFQTGSNTVVPVSATLDPAWEPPAEEPGPVDDGTAAGDPVRDEQGIRADLAYRLVVDPDYLREPGALQKLDDWVEAGQQVRVVSERLPKVMVADGEIALVKVAPASAVVLHGPLAGLAQALFDAMWRSARPYMPRDGELDGSDVQLLQLMLAGLTDAAMASQLGASPRTVQRRLRALMDAVGATTRIQLGGYAVRHGWV
ncbi:hypothetical protein [Luteimicrobium sp. DT211]|uniref:hypothetical protein n=1 Tax=Luteimicrobium sp. DT211 TaxID=3393412 RepID=UPI003CE8B0C6